MTRPLVRPGHEADIATLLEIERRAAALLLGHEAHDLFAMHSLSQEDLLRGACDGGLRVAEMGGEAVGFALFGELDGHAHLFEMDVLPEHGRRGIGGALLEDVCAQARRRDFRAITLTTLRDVPWNAPFYAKHGFSEPIEKEWSQGLREIVVRERMLGFPMRLRVVMRRELAPPGFQKP